MGGQVNKLWSIHMANSMQEWIWMNHRWMQQHGWIIEAILSENKKIFKQRVGLWRIISCSPNSQFDNWPWQQQGAEAEVDSRHGCSSGLPPCHWGSKSSGEGNAHLGCEVEGHPLPEQLDSWAELPQRPGNRKWGPLPLRYFQRLVTSSLQVFSGSPIWIDPKAF